MMTIACTLRALATMSMSEATLPPGLSQRVNLQYRRKQQITAFLLGVWVSKLYSCLSSSACVLCRWMTFVALLYRLVSFLLGFWYVGLLLGQVSLAD